ncbi:MAG TPA: hypothetical protein VHU18_06300 [Rhizomicrobium sp.]|nr:hypothetical protein [Rhizomicrobium sp.]
MPTLKVQTWRPDTHPGHVLEVEWEYDMEAGRDTGHEHRSVSVLYPDGTLIHRDTHGSEVAHEHYKRLHTEHVTKNHAYALIVDALPAKYKKAVLDSDGDPILDDNGQPGLTIKDKHKPRFKHLGAGRYEFALPGVDDSTTGELAVQLSQEFGDRIVLLRPAS